MPLDACCLPQPTVGLHIIPDDYILILASPPAVECWQAGGLSHFGAHGPVAVGEFRRDDDSFVDDGGTTGAGACREAALISQA